MNENIIKTENESKKIKNIALLGGSFDPITTAHLQIAAEIYNQLEDIDEVWLIPCGDGRDDKKVTHSSHRISMINLLLKDFISSDIPLKIEDIEIQQKRYIPSYELMKIMEKTYPDFDFHFCIGSDLLNGIRSWKPNGDLLVKEYSFIIINRPNYEIDPNLLPEKSRVIQTNYDLSSSLIRQRISQNKKKKLKFGISGLTSNSVIQYIIDNGLYDLDKIKQEGLLEEESSKNINSDVLKVF